jgi:hypothetical protein
MTPVKPDTFESPVVEAAPQLQHDIVRAHDESSDIEDAVMILKHLEII